MLTSLEKKGLVKQMSKVILVIDMPQTCCDCPCLNHEYGFCEVTGTSVSSDTKSYDCPLKPLPPKMDQKFADEYFCGYRGYDIKNAMGEGWNYCLEEILGGDEYYKLYRTTDIEEEK